MLSLFIYHHCAQISQVMYLELDRRCRKKTLEEENIVTEFGQKALVAIKKLQ